MSDRNLNASIKTKFYIYTDLENLVKIKNGKIIKFFKLIKVFVLPVSRADGVFVLHVSSQSVS